MLAEEAHRQYRELVGGSKRIKTNDRRKLREATVVTGEMLMALWEQGEKSDAVKASRKAKKVEKAFDRIVTDTTSEGCIIPKPSSKKKKKVQIASLTTAPSTIPANHSYESDWEEELGGEVVVDDGSGSEGSEYMEPICAISSQLGQLQVGGSVSQDVGGNLGRNSVVSSEVRRSGRIPRNRR